MPQKQGTATMMQTDDRQVSVSGYIYSICNPVCSFQSPSLTALPESLPTSEQGKPSTHRVEGQEEGRWVGLGASAEGLEVAPEEEAQAWEVPVSELEAQPGHSAAAAAVPAKSQWMTRSLKVPPH